MLKNDYFSYHYQMDLKQLENELSYYDLPSKRLDEIKNIAKRFAASQVERIDPRFLAQGILEDGMERIVQNIELQKHAILKELE